MDNGTITAADRAHRDRATRTHRTSLWAFRAIMVLLSLGVGGDLWRLLRVMRSLGLTGDDLRDAALIGWHGVDVRQTYAGKQMWLTWQLNDILVQVLLALFLGIAFLAADRTMARQRRLWAHVDQLEHRSEVADDGKHEQA